MIQKRKTPSQEPPNGKIPGGTSNNRQMVRKWYGCGELSKCCESQTRAYARRVPFAFPKSPTSASPREAFGSSSSSHKSLSTCTVPSKHRLPGPFGSSSSSEVNSGQADPSLNRKLVLVRHYYSLTPGGCVLQSLVLRGPVLRSFLRSAIGANSPALWSSPNTAEVF